MPKRLLGTCPFDFYGWMHFISFGFQSTKPYHFIQVQILFDRKWCCFSSEILWCIHSTPMRYLDSTNCLWCESFPDGPSSSTDEVGEVGKGGNEHSLILSNGKCGGLGGQSNMGSWVYTPMDHPPSWKWPEAMTPINPLFKIKANRNYEINLWKEKKEKWNLGWTPLIAALLECKPLQNKVGIIIINIIIK